MRVFWGITCKKRKKVSIGSSMHAYIIYIRNGCVRVRAYVYKREKRTDTKDIWIDTKNMNRQKKEYLQKKILHIVRRMRLELTRSCDHYPLKVACIPISPPALAFGNLCLRSPHKLKFAGTPFA